MIGEVGRVLGVRGGRTGSVRRVLKGKLYGDSTGLAMDCKAIEDISRELAEP